jgi:hypothetical protein
MMKKIYTIIALVVLIVPQGLLASGDIFTTFSDAQYIHGVNWGTVTTTDHSLLISNAHLIPFVSGSPITFKVEWGLGNETGNNADYTQIGTTPAITLNPPYTFNLPISNLQPGTDYYFTILESYPLGNPNAGDFNLFTYGFAPTNLLSENDIHYELQNNNADVRVYGNLIAMDMVTPFSFAPITIDIHQSSPGAVYDPNSTIVASFDTITSGFNPLTGNAYFEHVFSGLPAGSYYINIISSSNTQMTVPKSMIIPPNGNNPNPNPNNNLNPSTTYSGLIACGGPDCDFNAFVDTINRVVDFLIVFIMFPLVAIVVAWAGFQLITSGGSSSAKEHAKSSIKHILTGLIVALLSWCIIKLVLITLGYHGPLLQIFGIN